eukprot:191722_1
MERTLSLHKLLFFMLVNINIHSYAQWNVTTISTPSLPRGDFNTAVGWYQDTIYIFGGYQLPNTWIEYIISDNTMIDRGPDALPFTTNGHGDFYTQMNDKLYWIGGTGQYNAKSIYFYDFIFKTFNEATTMTTNGTAYSCLTSHNDLLFVVGGFYQAPMAFNNTHAFNISSHEWIQSIAVLNWHRREPACTVDTQRGVIYAIAGGDPWRPSFETLAIGEDITQSQWILNHNTLNYQSWGIKAVYVEYTDSILVIGGTSNISTIDCKTGTISVVAKLNYPVLAAGVVLADNILYVLSGYQSIDTWQRVINPLVFGAPTNWTYNPTRGTSANPSVYPSSDPSAHPSFIPSSYPSAHPSQTPSGNPSNPPTQIPSGFPSASPTDTNDGRVNEYISTTDVYMEQNEQSTMVSKTSTVIWIPVIVCVCCILLFIIAYFVWKKRKERVKNDGDMHNKMPEAIGAQEIDVQPGEVKNETDIGTVSKQKMYPQPALVAHGVEFAAQPSVDVEDLYDNEGLAPAETNDPTAHGTDSAVTVHTKGSTDYGPVQTKCSTNSGNKVGEGREAKGEGVGRTADNDAHCCTDCGLVKMGYVYYGDGLFYCNDCAAYYG